MTFFAENPHSKGKMQVEQNLDNQRLDSKLQKMFTPRPFSHRWRRSNQAALVLSYLCSLFSGLTAFTIISFLIYFAFLPVLGSLFSVVISVLVSALIVVIIEALKRYSLNNFLRDVLQFGSFSVSLFLLVLALATISVVVSFYGAKQLPTSINQLTEVNELDTTAIASNYNSEIKTLLFEKKEYFENNKKSNDHGGFRLSSKWMPTYNQMITDLSVLRTDKKSAIEAAKIEHKTSQNTAKENDISLGQKLGYWALSIELTFVLSMLGIWLYYWNCYKERFANKTNDSEIATNENRSTDDDTPTQQKTKDETNENRSKLRACDFCGTEYIYNHKKQRFCSDHCRKQSWDKKTKKSSLNGVT